MKKEIADKWVTALRSGDYPQDEDMLRTNKGFCCLGVLCDLHAKEYGKEWEIIQNEDEAYHYLNTMYLLPDEVIVWSDIQSETGVFGPPNEDGEKQSLVNLNDGGKSFAEIADVIETHWKVL